MDMEQKTGSFVLQHIYQHPESQPFILATQAQLFAIITKLGWLENEEFRSLVDNMQVFFQVKRSGRHPSCMHASNQSSRFFFASPLNQSLHCYEIPLDRISKTRSIV